VERQWSSKYACKFDTVPLRSSTWNLVCLQYQVVFEASKLPLQRAAKGGGKCMTDASPDEAGPAQAPLLDRGANLLSW